MEMTSAEIIRDYQQAKNKRQEIEILAQLNDTTPEEIKEILRSKGIDLRSANARIKKKVIEAADPVPGEEGYIAKSSLSATDVEAPPLGIAPREIAEALFNESRIRDIVAAMNRYYEANKAIPVKWCEELKERL